MGAGGPQLLPITSSYLTHLPSPPLHPPFFIQTQGHSVNKEGGRVMTIKGQRKGRGSQGHLVGNRRRRRNAGERYGKASTPGSYHFQCSTKEIHFTWKLRFVLALTGLSCWVRMLSSTAEAPSELVIKPEVFLYFKMNVFSNNLAF